MQQTWDFLYSRLCAFVLVCAGKVGYREESCDPSTSTENHIIFTHWNMPAIHSL